jgi:hypothetical protein
MRKYQAAFATLVLLFAQQSFAESEIDSSGLDDSTTPSCETIANACLSAGYARDGAAGKAFWGDCMKPALLGQTVSGVSIEHKDAVACRKFKIEKLKSAYHVLEQVK